MMRAHERRSIAMKRILFVLCALPLLGSSADAGTNASAVPWIQVEQGEEWVEVRVGATGLRSVNAVHVDVEFDPDGLEFLSFEPGDLFRDPMVLGPFVRADRNLVDITTATLDGPEARNESRFGILKFRVVDPDRGDVRIASFQTADDSWEVETLVARGNAIGADALPAGNRLLGNRPNPFNPLTEIVFTLGAPGEVLVAIFDVSGRKVRTLEAGAKEAGLHHVVWDGKDDSGAPVASGIYFCKLRAGDFVESRKMFLVK